MPGFSRKPFFTDLFHYILSVLYWHYGKSREPLEKGVRTKTKAINNSFGLELKFPHKISSETSIFMLICIRTLLKEAAVYATGKY